MLIGSLPIERKRLTDLKPAEYNPRKALTPEDAEWQKIKNSIEKFEYIDPIIINKDGTIIGGHQRYSVMTALGYDEIDVVVLDLSKEDEKALNIALNKISGEWDNLKLKDLLLELDLGDYDISITGFDNNDLENLVELFEVEPDVSEDNYDAEQAYDDSVKNGPVVKQGEVWQLGRHKLMCGSATDINDVKKLLGGEMLDLIITDPPYNVNYEEKAEALNEYRPNNNGAMKIENDLMGNEEFYSFLFKAYSNMYEFMRAGAAIYVFHADSEGLNFRKAFVDVGLKLSECLIWEKNNFVLGRCDYHWRHEPCQPAGTMVRTPNGYVPIEQLKDGDEVVSFDTYSGTVTGYKNGLKVKTANREYAGELYGIRIGDKQTWTTDNHQFSVRFNPDSDQIYCTYLMRAGNRWRVGITRTYDARGFGLKHRMHQEHAEEGWIIDTFKSKLDAQIGEQLLAVKYGIPYTHWEVEKGFVNQKCATRTSEHIEWLYNHLDLEVMEQNANRLLADYGRSRKYPLVYEDVKGVAFSRRVTAKINACNIIPGLMMIPVPFEKWDTPNNNTFEWHAIDSVDRKYFEGTVYSLAVERFEHYIADGLVTHNCLYGWKPGAAHYFINDRTQDTILLEDDVDFESMKKQDLIQYIKDMQNKFHDQTSVIYEKKPMSSSLHPTMKPLELVGKLMKNSSKQGGNVGDFFGGSGSTLMAAEQLGRTAFVMELSETYASVIIDRWEQYTGQKAVRLE